MYKFNTSLIFTYPIQRALDLALQACNETLTYPHRLLLIYYRPDVHHVNENAYLYIYS